MMKKIMAVLLAMVMLLGCAQAALADTTAVVKTKYSTSTVNLRAGEGTGYAAVGYVTSGETVTILTLGSIWTKVQKQNGTVGYIRNDYLGSIQDGTTFERGKNVYVSENGGSLKVRAGEGTDYGVNGYVQHGDAITLLSIGETWAKIRVNKSGVTGYIKNIYLYGYATAGWGSVVESLLGGGGSTPVTPSGAYDAAIVTTKYSGSTVNIRAGAGSSYAAVGSAKSGAYLKIWSSDGNWYKVTTKSGLTGYISKNYVALGAPARTTANLNVRSAAGSSNKLITTLAKGTKVTILSVDGNWCKIRYGNSSIGYVSIRFLNY